MTPNHNGSIASQFQDLIKLLGSIATILAIYTGLNWFVVNLYFNSLSTQMTNMNSHLVAVEDWRSKSESQIAVVEHRVGVLEGRSGVVQTKGKLTK